MLAREIRDSSGRLDAISPYGYPGALRPDAEEAIDPASVDWSPTGLVSLFVSRWNNLVGLGLGSPGRLRYQSVGSIDNIGANVGLDGAVAKDHVHYAISVTNG